ncbi:hypothetical protein FGE05_05615 [Pseudomonas sp. ICMP22404]|nr:hypothetical protein FGE05_05615 [Pseudomonas sp. ICMP22404]
MARGFIPAGARSGPKILGLLRSPAGMNPLATMNRASLESTALHSGTSILRGHDLQRDMDAMSHRIEGWRGLQLHQ